MREWLQFRHKEGWGTDTFEDSVPAGYKFPEAWASVDDRYDARAILDKQFELLEFAKRKRLEVLRNGFLLGEIITERAGNCIIMSLGSGPHAHGQLLIYHDLFGLYPKFTPRMAKVYGNAGQVILDGVKQYVAEVTDGTFPQPQNYFGMQDAEYDELMAMLD